MGLSHARAVLLMVLVTFMWGTAGVVTRLLESAASFEVTFWRSFFAFLTLLVVLPLWQGAGFFDRLRREGRVLLLSGMAWSVMFTAFMLALTLTSVANAFVTTAVGPLLTALVARLWLGHPLAVRTWLAIVAAGFGMAWMFASEMGSGQWLGSLVALAVPLAGALNWTLIQRHQHRSAGGDMVPAVLIGALISSIVTLLLAWPLKASVHDIAWLGALGTFQLALPCVGAVMCARVLSAPEVSMLALLEVIFGIVLAWAFVGEQPPKDVMLGGSVVLLALLSNEWLGMRERQRDRARLLPLS